MNWWQLESAKIISELHSSEKGLPSAAAEKLFNEVGPNQLQEKKRKSAFSIFLNQFKDFMILVLLAAAIVAGIVGDLTDTIIIAVIILLNAIVGFFQENKAEEAMEALKRISALQAHVLRDGRSIVIPAEEIVPGDVVIIEAGAIVPADMRLLEAHALTVNESALTGESVPVEKTTKPIPEKDLPIGDRVNMAYKSTVVTNGRGKGLVVATGMQTEIGSIAKMLQQNEEATPLQKRMADFGRRLSYLVLLICALFFLIGYLRGSDVMTLLLTSISLAVAAIPEALPALITVALARGAKRLARKNALIRKLSAVETLGSVTFICSDKTGTLTQNKMKVVTVESSGSNKVDDMHPLMLGLALNHDTKQIGSALGGDPTEVAIVEYFHDEYGGETFQDVHSRYPRIAEVPFDSDRKCMSTAHRFNDEYLIISKGAVESIVAALHDRTSSRSILNDANHVAHDGIRVIAFGYKIVKELPDPFTSKEVERDLLFAGFVGLIDPPR